MVEGGGHAHEFLKWRFWRVKIGEELKQKVKMRMKISDDSCVSQTWKFVYVSTKLKARHFVQSNDVMRSKKFKCYRQLGGHKSLCEKIASVYEIQCKIIVIQPDQTQKKHRERDRDWPDWRDLERKEEKEFNLWIELDILIITVNYTRYCKKPFHEMINC